MWVPLLRHFYQGLQVVFDAQPSDLARWVTYLIIPHLNLIV